MLSGHSSNWLTRDKHFYIGINGSEDCLFLNIFTPFLPVAPGRRGSPGLKSIMMFIHGGEFLYGNGGDPIYDGGNLTNGTMLFQTKSLLWTGCMQISPHLVEIRTESLSLDNPLVLFLFEPFCHPHQLLRSLLRLFFRVAR